MINDKVQKRLILNMSLKVFIFYLLGISIKRLLKQKY